MPWSRSRRWTTSAIVAILLVATACDDGASDTVDPEDRAPTNLTAEVRLSGFQNVTGDLATCSGAGQFVDVYRGAHAVVADETGRPVANGSITVGLATNYYQDVLDECTFRVRVSLVPRSKGYLLVIGRQRPRPFSDDLLRSYSGRLKFDLNAANVRGATR